MIIDIFDKLKEKKFNPYYKGQHEGLCKDPFVIVAEGNQIPNINSNKLGQKIIDIIVMVPINSYLAVDPYVENIRNALKELDYLRKTGTETPVIVDDNKKAYTMSIEYVLQKKLEG